MAGPVLFKRIALIGIGLIGSSLARVVKREGLAGHIVACARSAETLEAASRLGIADSIARDPAEAVRDADLVVICTPIGSYDAIAKAMAPALRTITPLSTMNRSPPLSTSTPVAR